MLSYSLLHDERNDDNELILYLYVVLVQGVQNEASESRYIQQIQRKYYRL